MATLPHPPHVRSHTVSVTGLVYLCLWVILAMKFLGRHGPYSVTTTLQLHPFYLCEESALGFPGWGNMRIANTGPPVLTNSSVIFFQLPITNLREWVPYFSSFPSWREKNPFPCFCSFSSYFSKLVAHFMLSFDH